MFRRKGFFGRTNLARFQAKDPDTITQADIDAAVSATNKKRDEQEAGLKASQTALLEEKKKLKEQLDELTAKFKVFDGVDPQQVKALLDAADNDETLKLIKEGKWKEVLERHTQKLNEAHSKELKKKDDAYKALETKVSSLSSRALDGILTAAATTAGIHESAIEDVLNAGRQVFSLNEEGIAVQMKDGDIVVGSNGKDPFSPGEWIEGQREKRGHWFPAGSTGAGGAGRTTSAGKGRKETLTREAFSKLSGDEQRAFSAKMTKGEATIDG
jgi:hypothetical protein